MIIAYKRIAKTIESKSTFDSFYRKNNRIEKRCVKGPTPEWSHKRITCARSNVHVDKLRVRELRAERFYVLYAQCGFFFSRDRYRTETGPFNRSVINCGSGVTMLHVQCQPRSSRPDPANDVDADLC